MFKVIGGWLRGVAGLLSYTVFTLVLAVPLFLFALLKFIWPGQRWRQWWSRGLVWVAEAWADCWHFCARLAGKLRIEVKGLEALKRHEWYLIIANHQSWVDIFVLSRIFHRRIPDMKFFIKRPLLFLPVVGFAFWALDFPIMRRYTRSQIAKNPALKGKDIEASRRACEKYKTLPVSIINFVEGTRFKTKRYLDQRPPYKYLLKPRAGGIAYVLASMGKQLDYLLDVTIVYPAEIKDFWSFLCGKIKTVKVHIDKLPILQDMIGDYDNDPVFKERFQSWLNELWEKKDRRIGEMMAEG